MFFEKYECDIAGYVYDNTHHASDSDLYTVFSKLENCKDGLREIIQNQRVISPTASFSQLKNQLFYKSSVKKKKEV